MVGESPGAPGGAYRMVALMGAEAPLRPDWELLAVPPEHPASASAARTAANRLMRKTIVSLLAGVQGWVCNHSTALRTDLFPSRDSRTASLPRWPTAPDTPPSMPPGPPPGGSAPPPAVSRRRHDRCAATASHARAQAA